MRRHWVFRTVENPAVDQLAKALAVPPLIARLLIHRGFHSPDLAHGFLCPELSTLSPPDRMADLEKGVDLLRRAAALRKKILIVGDYDVDGLTGSAILYRTLAHLGAEVEVYIPHRLEEGYGLKLEFVRKAHENGVKLLLTVDCGTTSFKELEEARALGLESIVVDHHDLDQGKRPPASAFLNPLQPACAYPEKEMASVGVAFTLARGLASAIPGGKEWVWQHLDLVALGTVADVAPLKGENRVLVKAGLQTLRGTAKPGLRALIEKAGLKEESLTPEDVSFRLAPPLNAMGRMGSAESSFQLLVTEDPEQAAQLAQAVFRQNRARGALEREAFQKALWKVTREVNFSQDRVIVLEDEEWHPGVIGILASRLAHRFHRPAVVIARGSPTCRGSARSIPAFHLIEALQAVKEHLIDFGGHPAAAGLAIAPDRIGGFREAINRLAHEKLQGAMLTPCVEVDAEIPLSELTEEILEEMEVLAPFGTGNPRPIFVCRDAQMSGEDQRPTFGPSGMRLRVQTAQGHCFEAIQPREALWDAPNFRRLRGPVHLAYSPVCRRVDGQVTIELSLRDMKFSAA